MATIQELLLEPLNQAYSAFLTILPGILWFLGIALVGYLVASCAGYIVRKVLLKINIDKRLRRMDLHDSLGKVSIAKIASTISKWYMFILFLDQAVGFLRLGALSQFIRSIVNWLPDLLLSITIIIVGLILIDFIMHKLLELENKYIQVIANLLKGILVIIIIFTAIEQLPIETVLARNIFLMAMGAILITFSLSLGIGLGLSLKDEFKPVIKDLKKKFK